MRWHKVCFAVEDFAKRFHVHSAAAMASPCVDSHLHSFSCMQYRCESVSDVAVNRYKQLSDPVPGLPAGSLYVGSCVRDAVGR